jgi:hypothetical protein
LEAIWQTDWPLSSIKMMLDFCLGERGYMLKKWTVAGGNWKGSGGKTHWVVTIIYVNCICLCFHLFDVVYNETNLNAILLSREQKNCPDVFLRLIGQ